MSVQDSTPLSVSAVEALMLDKFETEPFHNLRLLYSDQLHDAVPGGTCSDKTLSFLSAAERAGFVVALHSGFIGGQEIHRLARVQVGGCVYFADIGNGWPALKLYPVDREVSFRCFGMGFRTAINGERLRVFHERRGRESLQLEVDVRGRPERNIRADIEQRFNSGVIYPFSHSLRFSLVVGRRFLFLRGDRLEIYSDSSFDEVVGIQPNDVPAVISHHFGYTIGPLGRPSIEGGES